jgi:uncharacterized protein YbjT (DUF2867 family)
MSSPPVVLVIGASGAVGWALIDEFVPDHRAGRLRLVAATRKQEAARSLRERGVEVRHLDLGDAEAGGLDTIQSAFAGVARVFLVSGLYIRMLIQCKAAIDAAKAMGASHIVYLGACATEDTAISHLGRHVLVDAYLKRSGLGFKHVRPAGFRQNLLLSAAALGILTYFCGDGRVNRVDIGDIATRIPGRGDIMLGAWPSRCRCPLRSRVGGGRLPGSSSARGVARSLSRCTSSLLR